MLHQAVPDLVGWPAHYSTVYTFVQPCVYLPGRSCLWVIDDDDNDDDEVVQVFAQLALA